MRNLLAFLAAVAITLGVVGWYLDWYKVRSVPASSGQRSLSIDIHTDKIGTDIESGAKELQHLLDKNGTHADKAAEHKEPAPAPAANQGTGRLFN
jgi:hypothetical protein